MGGAGGGAGTGVALGGLDSLDSHFFLLAAKTSYML
jgi:hypothetical protein